MPAAREVWFHRLGNYFGVDPIRGIDQTSSTAGTGTGPVPSTSRSQNAQGGEEKSIVCFYVQ